MLLAVSMTAQAQTAPWVTYTPSNRSSSNSFSYNLNPLSSYDAEFAEMERRHYQNKYQNEVIESEVFNSSAISTATGNPYSIQIKSELKRSGAFSFTCIGIKMNNRWVSCESQIIDLQEVYKQAKTQADKSAILEILEVASFVFQYNNTLYLIPKPED